MYINCYATEIISSFYVFILSFFSQREWQSVKTGAKKLKNDNKYINTHITHMKITL